MLNLVLSGTDLGQLYAYRIQQLYTSKLPSTHVSLPTVYIYVYIYSINRIYTVDILNGWSLTRDRGIDQTLDARRRVQR